MRFQAMYDAAKAKDGRALIVRIADNIVPFDGWFVPDRLDLDLVIEGSLHEFDEIVERTVRWAVAKEVEYIALAINDQVVWAGAGHVFADMKYAMGYSHGVGLDGIYDVGTGRLIKRK